MSSRLEITSLDHYEENDNIKSIKVGIDLSENTGVIIFPTGSIAERPTNPEKSSFRFNTQTRKLEYYDGSDWVNTDGSSSFYQYQSDEEALADNLVLHYPCEPDDIINVGFGTVSRTSYNLTIDGGLATQNAFSRGTAADNGIKFSGISTSENMTWSMWINISDGTFATGGAGIWWLQENSQNVLWHYDTSATTPTLNFLNWGSNGSTGLQLQLNSWYHLVATRSSSTTWKSYVNGVLRHSLNNQTRTVGTTQWFGNYSLHTSPPDTGNKFFRGSFDEIGIWNRELTENEIQNLYRFQLNEGKSISVIE